MLLSYYFFLCPLALEEYLALSQISLRSHDSLKWALLTSMFLCNYKCNSKVGIIFKSFKVKKPCCSTSIKFLANLLGLYNAGLCSRVLLVAKNDQI